MREDIKKRRCIRKHKNANNNKTKNSIVQNKLASGERVFIVLGTY